MATERRRDNRYPCQVRVVLAAGRRETVARTEDVSFNGLAVRTDLPLEGRQLVRMRLTLPPEGDELAATGMVVRRSVADGGVPVAAVQFYGLSRAHRTRWERFIRQVAASVSAAAAPEATTAAEAATTQEAAAAPPAPEAPSAATPEPVRRSHPRYAATLRVHLQTVDDLYVLYTRNVSRGGLFVATALDLAAGTALKISVIHPKTGDLFPLEAVVRWRIGGADPGLGISFENMTEELRQDFFEFIRSEVPLEEVVYVSEGDPRLVGVGPGSGGGTTRE